MKKLTKKSLIALSLAAVIVGGGSTSAYADLTIENFGGHANAYQQSRYLGWSPHESPTYPGSSIEFYTNGGYLMNAKTEDYVGDEYAETKGIPKNVLYNVQNLTWGAEGLSRFIITNYTWTVASPSISGFFQMH